VIVGAFDEAFDDIGDLTAGGGHDFGPSEEAGHSS